MMIRYINPPQKEWQKMLERPMIDASVIIPRVASIIGRVKVGGDAELFSLTQELDGVKLDNLETSAQEIIDGAAKVNRTLAEAIEKAANNISKFHEAQQSEDICINTAEGVECRMKNVAINSVGLYIPGGSAPLFSTVLMLGIPAKIAKCREVIMCTPPDKNGEINPAILFAAQLCGISKIYKIGGAQAIAAMAYGTETIKKVDKIFGPGNQYVTIAKQMVSIDKVAIDMPAGPSEVLVMADSSSNPAFVAADLLSQAEHGADSQVILVTNCSEIVDLVENEIEKQLKLLPRETTARKALENSRVFVFDTVEKMVELTNLYAPEHLIISMQNDDEIASMIESAGSIFLGNYSPESVGDYASGTNHTLPTGGWAASYSGVNLGSFQKKIMLQRITPEGLKNIGKTIETMASAEGLEAHKQAVSIRLEELLMK